MTDEVEDECEDCRDDFSFECLRCGFQSCGKHAQEHTVEDCDFYLEDTRDAELRR